LLSETSGFFVAEQRAGGKCLDYSLSYVAGRLHGR
jgi:hypothetical protein